MKYEQCPGRKDYWNVWLDNPKDVTKFIGIRKNKKDGCYIVEKNLTNAIVLGDTSLMNIRENPNAISLLPENLFEYQKPDVMKMVTHGRMLNANKMGYGKTIEAICALRLLNIRNAIIVAPKPILEQWKCQFDAWWKLHPTIAINPKKPIKGINIYNYEQIMPDLKQEMLRSRVWDALVVDEAHRIKNPKAKRTLACCSIPARYKFALTGTPIMKSPEDLYSQLNFLDPKYGGKSFYAFRNYYCEIKMGFFGEEVKGLTHNDFRVDVLNKLLDYVAVRNPDRQLTIGKQKITVKLGLNNKQRKLYKDIVTLILDELPDKATIPNGAVKVLRAVQATSSPSVFIPGLWGAKFEWIKMVLEDNPSEKFVVFSRFAETLKELQKYLRTNYIDMKLYTGKQSIEERLENKHLFMHDKNVRVLGGTIACLGEGVDGLQEASHIAIFIDRAYTPETLSQCEDRLNRPGQKGRVLCYYLECSGTYDRHIGRVNETRAEDIRRALNDEDIDT